MKVGEKWYSLKTNSQGALLKKCWEEPFILSFLGAKRPYFQWQGTQIHPVAARCTKDLLSDSLLRHPDYLSILSDSPLEILFMNLWVKSDSFSTTV